MFRPVHERPCVRYRGKLMNSYLAGRCTHLLSPVRPPIRVSARPPVRSTARPLVRPSACAKVFKYFATGSYYFSALLKPWVHYVPIREDLTDLIPKVTIYFAVCFCCLLPFPVTTPSLLLCPLLHLSSIAQVSHGA